MQTENPLGIKILPKFRQCYTEYSSRIDIYQKAWDTNHDCQLGIGLVTLLLANWFNSRSTLTNSCPYPHATRAIGYWLRLTTIPSQVLWRNAQNPLFFLTCSDVTRDTSLCPKLWPTGSLK